MDDWKLALQHLNREEGGALLSMIGAVQVGNWFWKTPGGRRYLYIEGDWVTEEQVVEALTEAMNFDNSRAKHTFVASALESWRRV
jgi:hypothetical protein